MCVCVFISLLQTSWFYLVSFTLTCSAAAFGNVFIFPTQNINHTDCKNAFKNIGLFLPQYKNPSYDAHLQEFLTSWCFWFSSCVLGFEGYLTYQLQIVTQPVQQWLLQRAFVMVGSEHHWALSWGEFTGPRFVIPKVRKLN